MKSLRLTILVISVFVFANSGSLKAQQQFFSIGTGGVTGIYYQAGGAICRLVNKDRKKHLTRCSVESTGGSIYNINTIRQGELEFGVAQSDWQYHAHNGTSKFKDKGPFKNLRAVFSVHSEPVTILARADSGIKSIADFKGKRVNIGNPGSGQFGTWEAIEKTMRWRRSDLKLATQLKSSETAQALCDNKIDAYFLLVGHPSALTQETIASCDALLVNASFPGIESFLAANPYYRSTVIPANMYNNDKDIETFGVGATFITSADIPDKFVEIIVRAVFENFNQFKKLHPAFSELKVKEMVKDSLSAPLHPAALKYYQTKGWLE
ncbi:MAG: TAXI family TRAP transporter solute-binding subunit [Hyphomicrobiaceae bacterium]|nr:TAXI family TRAP transporter solute-binding subunit [Hyphomicrobiaceae bacterium]